MSSKKYLNIMIEKEEISYMSGCKDQMVSRLRLALLIASEQKVSDEKKLCDFMKKLMVDFSIEDALFFDEWRAYLNFKRRIDSVNQVKKM